MLFAGKYTYAVEILEFFSGSIFPFWVLAIQVCCEKSKLFKWFKILKDSSETWIFGFVKSVSDGFSALFYHKCWEIIKDNLTDAIKDFFNGRWLHEGITATSIIKYD